MTAPFSSELQRIFAEAEEVATSVGARCNTAHLLLALFTFPNPASSVLEERDLDYRLVCELFNPKERESDSLLDVVKHKVRHMATACGARAADPLHLLGVLARSKGGLAFGVLERAGVDLGDLRTTVLAYCTGRLPRHLERFSAKGKKQPVFGLGGSTIPGGRLSAGSTRKGISDQLDLMPVERAMDPPKLQGNHAGHPEELRALVTRVTHDHEPAGSPLKRPNEQAEKNGSPPHPSRGEREERSEGGAEGGHEFAHHGEQLGRAFDDESYSMDGDESVEHMRSLELDVDEYPLLCSLGQNLTIAAAEGRIDPLVGRETEIEQLLDILHKRRANNPCIVGEPGVGKTAIVEGLALRLAERHAARSERGLGGAEGRSVQSATHQVIISLDVGTLVAGTHLRGSFSERMASLRAEVQRASNRVVVFFDEIHTLLGSGGSGEGALDAVGELKGALARGEFPCIGTTTVEEYRRVIEDDPALARRFQAVMVSEPSTDDAITILSGVAERYEKHHGVGYGDDAIREAVKLSVRYMPERRLPDKAIAVLDLAGARARRNNVHQIDRELVARVVASIARIPVEKLLLSDTERLMAMEADLAKKLVGHGEVLCRIAQAIRRNQAGFVSKRPIGSFLFLGPTGVGKTELAKVLADQLFQTREALTRIDMSEFMESHSAARLVGAPPGYVGYGDGGQLTEAIRLRPYQIVLLDEVEKAHRDVLNLLLQILDEGRLTDSKGRTVDFCNTIIILTSNLGSGLFHRPAGKRVGFLSNERGHEGSNSRRDEETTEMVLESVRGEFPPELWNRFDERLVFLPLGRDEIGQIARLLLEESSKRLREERGISFGFDDSIVDFLLERGGFEPELGARPMRRAVQRLVEGPLSEALLRGAFVQGDRISVSVDEQGALQFSKDSLGGH